MCWGRLVRRISFGTTGVLHRPSRRTRIVSNGSAGAATATLQHDVEWRLRLAYTDEEGAGTMVSTTTGPTASGSVHKRHLSDGSSPDDCRPECRGAGRKVT